ARWVERHADVGLALAAGQSTGLQASTQAYFGALDGRMTMTYFVSSRRAMPSGERAVEDAVVALLSRIKAAAPQKVDIRVLDPDVAPDPGAEPAAAAAGPEPGNPAGPAPGNPFGRREPRRFTGREYAASRGASPVEVRKVLHDESGEVAMWSSLVIA